MIDALKSKSCTEIKEAFEQIIEIFSENNDMLTLSINLALNSLMNFKELRQEIG